MNQYYYHHPKRIQLLPNALTVIIRLPIENSSDSISLHTYVIKIIVVFCVIVFTNIEVIYCPICFRMRSRGIRFHHSCFIFTLSGDCSFHIRRKHHRYSANSNDYIQRFHFEASEGNDGITDQSGSIGSSLHGPLHPSHFSKDLDEPARYFGCPYCDYTSNYGGDVR